MDVPGLSAPLVIDISERFRFPNTEPGYFICALLVDAFSWDSRVSLNKIVRQSMAYCRKVPINLASLYASTTSESMVFRFNRPSVVGVRHTGHSGLTVRLSRIHFDRNEVIPV